MSDHFRKLERMYEQSPINRFFRPSIRVEEGRAEIRLNLRSDLLQTGGTLDGSVCFKALEDAARFAVNSCVEEVLVTSAGFQVYWLRPVSEGEVVARAKVVHRARRLMLAEADLFDRQGQLLARGSGHFTRSRSPLERKLGYA